MTKEELRIVFSKAFCKFIKKDADLFEAPNTVQERAFFVSFCMLFERLHGRWWYEGYMWC